MQTMSTNLTIHRLLDEAFAGIAPTTTVLDLKEELRANLVARVEELEASGVAPDEAAHRAFTEVGDIRGLLDDAIADLTDAPGRPEWELHQVRLPAAFVIRATVAPLLGAVALALSFVVAAGAIPGGPAVAGALMAAFAFFIGFVTADALQQETSGSYPMPRRRAIGYGLGTGILLAGVGAGALCWVGGPPLWTWLAGGGILAIVGIAILAGLGATQTNREKPWAREQAAAWMAGRSGSGAVGGAGGPHGAAAEGEGSPWAGVARPGNRFETDHNAAARFGIYTAVVWIVAIAGGIVIGFTLAWWWAPLPLVGAVVVMLLLLTQMLFKPGSRR
jgi:hypothetical protein